MIERRREQLMQDVLDRQASPEQIRELQAWLASNHEGRARFEELEGLFKTLGQVSEVPAPEGLKDHVIEVLRRSHAPARAVARPRPARAALRPAFLFVAGMAAGVIGYSGLTRLPEWPPGDDRAAGTLMPQPDSPAGAETNRRSWTVGEARVEALAWHRDGALVVTLETQGRAEVVLEYPPGALKFRSIGQGGAPGSQFRSEPGRLTIAAADRSSFEIVWEPAAPPPTLTLTVRAGNEHVRGNLPLGPAR